MTAEDLGPCLPNGMTVDDASFMLLRYEVAFEKGENGEFYRNDIHAEFERRYLSIIRRMMEAKHHD